jgi:hypothetical protein
MKVIEGIALGAIYVMIIGLMVTIIGGALLIFSGVGLALW